MKVYSGDRTIDGLKVLVDGTALDPHVEAASYSRNGFEWSYEGLEPRQLAFALLYDHLGDAAEAKSLTDRFMARVVANFGNEWEMTSADIDRTLAVLDAAKHGAAASRQIH
jgi:Family of unknown function (DUF6166)